MSAELDIARKAARQLLAEYGDADFRDHGAVVRAYAALRDTLGNVLTALEDTGPTVAAAPVLGDFIQCSARCCSFGEWSGKAAERGWVQKAGGWLCVQCADAADERAQLVARMAATVELLDGTVTLTDWSLTELAPDFYGHSYTQIGGWLPEGYRPTVAHGTNHMVRADLPGIPDVAPDVDVTVESKGYGGPQRFMKIQWVGATYPANRLETLRDTGTMPAPLRGGR